MSTQRRQQQRYYNCWQGAIKRGKVFTLTESQFYKLLETPRCYYSGVLLDYTDPKKPNYATLERLDESLGYCIDNVVLCAKYMNSLREVMKHYKVNKVRVRSGKFSKPARKLGALR